MPSRTSTRRPGEASRIVRDVGKESSRDRHSGPRFRPWRRRDWSCPPLDQATLEKRIIPLLVLQYRWRPGSFRSRPRMPPNRNAPMRRWRARLGSKVKSPRGSPGEGHGKASLFKSLDRIRLVFLESQAGSGFLTIAMEVAFIEDEARWTAKLTRSSDRRAMATGRPDPGVLGAPEGKGIFHENSDACR